MTIEITDEIKAAYDAYMDEAVDADMTGTVIRRRNTYPYALNPMHGGLIDFAAGWKAAHGVPDVSQADQHQGNEGGA